MALKIAKVAKRFCQTLNKPSKKSPNRLKVLPKCRKYAQSGHTVPYVVPNKR